MRYTLGKKYVFVKVNFEEKNPVFYRMYKPWEDRLKSIDFFVMECIEHHKVHGTYGGHDKDCDGFIFKAIESTDPAVDKDSLWFNQYPRAQYGMISVDADDHLVPALKIQRYMHLAVGRDRPYDVRSLLRNIYNSICHPAFKGQGMEHARSSLQNWFVQLCEELQYRYQLDVVINRIERRRGERHTGKGYDTPVIVRPADGSF